MSAAIVLIPIAVRTGDKAQSTVFDGAVGVNLLGIGIGIMSVIVIDAAIAVGFTIVIHEVIVGGADRSPAVIVHSDRIVAGIISVALVSLAAVYGTISRIQEPAAVLCVAAVVLHVQLIAAGKTGRNAELARIQVQDDSAFERACQQEQQMAVGIRLRFQVIQLQRAVVLRGNRRDLAVCYGQNGSVGQRVDFPGAGLRRQITLQLRGAKRAAAGKDGIGGILQRPRRYDGGGRTVRRIGDTDGGSQRNIHIPAGDPCDVHCMGKCRIGGVRLVYRDVRQREHRVNVAGSSHEDRCVFGVADHRQVGGERNRAGTDIRSAGHGERIGPDGCDGFSAETRTAAIQAAAFRARPADGYAAVRVLDGAADRHISGAFGRDSDDGDLRRSISRAGDRGDVVASADDHGGP